MTTVLPVTPASLDAASTHAPRLQCSAEEWTARVQLAACYRIFAYLGWVELIYNHITLRLPGPDVALSHQPLRADVFRSARVEPGEDRPEGQCRGPLRLARKSCRVHRSRCNSRWRRRCALRDAYAHHRRHGGDPGEMHARLAAVQSQVRCRPGRVRCAHTHDRSGRSILLCGTWWSSR